MAFDWKWQQPSGMSLQDEQRLAMQGYKPNTVQMNGYEPSRAPDVVPPPPPQNYGMGGEGAIERGRMYGANNYGQGMAYQDNIKSLQEEYLRNVARISEIESEIANVKNEITAGKRSRNELDMALAANRARIGDIGNSLAHQQAINTREYQQYLRQLEQNKENQSKVPQLEQAVIDAYTELAWAEGEKQQQIAQFKVDKALEAYKKGTGKEYVNPFEAKKGGAKAGDTAQNLEMAWGKYTASFDKNKRPTKAAVAEFLKDAEGLPYSAELQSKIDEARNAKTQESASADSAKLAKKQQEAVDEIAGDIDSFKLSKGNGSYTATAKNGQSVSVTANEDGKTATIRCGKKSKVVNL